MAKAKAVKEVKELRDAHLTWDDIKTTLTCIGYDTTRYGDKYPIYGWDKNNALFIEWWYKATTPAERKKWGCVAGRTSAGFGIRDLSGTSHAPAKKKRTVKTVQSTKRLTEQSTKRLTERPTVQNILDQHSKMFLEVMARLEAIEKKLK